MAAPGSWTGRTLGHYRVLEEIGAGGMGVVFRARDERLERDVALKLLPPNAVADAEARRRFRSEARALSKLNHPNIATVFDFDTQEGTDFLVTEFIEGQGVDTLLGSGALPSSEVVRLGMQLAEGLAAAHQQGIVHRDLKPGNLRVTPDGRLKILDFGLAKLLEPPSPDAATLTQTQGGLTGTLPYMAPEQLRGEAADERTDIWAAGCVLYELAGGRRPFAGLTGPQVSVAILTQAPPPLAATVPAALQAVIERCLEKDPARRFQDAAQLRAALEAVRTGARSASSVVRLRRRRRRTVVAVAALAAVAALSVALDVGGLRARLAGSQMRIESLAVLPLENLSGDPEQEYFADGMTEALITELGQIARSHRVIGRGSVMRYKSKAVALEDIARELGVDALVTGAVLRTEGRVRVTAQLIDGRTAAQLWARRYERDLRDVLALQNDLTQAIASEIRLELSPAQEAGPLRAAKVNPAAHEAYLRGRHFWWKRTRAGLWQAVEQFEAAIALDPGYALAYSGLADAYSTLVNNGFERAGDVHAKARAAALRAVELDDTSAEVHTALGRFYRNFDWDWPRAEAEYRRAIALNPNHADAYLGAAGLLNFLRRPEEAIAFNRRAKELEPLNPRIGSHLGVVLYGARRFDEAERAAREMLRFAADDGQIGVVLARSLLAQNQPGSALAEMEVARRAGHPIVPFFFPAAYAALGRKTEAQAMVHQLVEESRRRHVSGYYLAAAQLAVASHDEVFASLERAFQERGDALPMISVECIWDPLRSDPRFRSLLRRMNLTDGSE